MKMHHMLVLGLSLAIMVACQTTEVAPAEDVGVGSDADAGGRAALFCDAIYVPRITFNITADGEPYCGDATITVEVTNLEGERAEGVTRCDCSTSTGGAPDAGAGLPANGTSRPGLEGCILDPDYGTSVVRLEAPGYEPVEATIELPYKCHPNALIEAMLVPL